MDIQGLKDKILQLAIQGKLVEQDENDEPASSLLQRIKEERDKLVREKKIKKPKKLLPIEEEEKPFEIPGSWEWVRLGEVSLQIPSKKYQIKQSDIMKEGRYPVVSQSINLIEGYSNFKDKLLMISNPVIIFGDHTKHVKYIDFNFIVGADGVKIINPLGIYGRFLYLSTLHNALCVEDRGYSRHFKFLNKKLIPLPPLAEQKRIVEKVDELFALIDELDSNKEDLLEVINLTRNQVLQEAIQGKLVEQNPEDEPASVLIQRIKEERDKLVKEKKIRKQKPLPEITKEEKPFEIPGSWEWVRLGEVVNLISGRDVPVSNCNDEGRGIPYIMGASNIDDEKLLIERWIEKPEVIAKKDDLILTVKGTVGKMMLLKEYEEVNLSRQVVAIRPICDMYQNYLYWFIKSHISNINDKSQGVIPGISRSDILEIVFPLPPLAEQKCIVEKVDMIMDMLDDLEKTVME